MTEQLLRLIALAGQGRAEMNRSRRAGVLFLGCPPVSVGQEADSFLQLYRPGQKTQSADHSLTSTSKSGIPPPPPSVLREPSLKQLQRFKTEAYKHLLKNNWT